MTFRAHLEDSLNPFTPPTRSACVVACYMPGRAHTSLYLLPGSRGGRGPIPIAMGSFSLRVTLGMQGGVASLVQWVRNVLTRIPVP